MSSFSVSRLSKGIYLQWHHTITWQRRYQNEKARIIWWWQTYSGQWDSPLNLRDIRVSPAFLMIKTCLVSPGTSFDGFLSSRLTNLSNCGSLRTAIKRFLFIAVWGSLQNGHNDKCYRGQASTQIVRNSREYRELIYMYVCMYICFPYLEYSFAWNPNSEFC